MELHDIVPQANPPGLSRPWLTSLSATAGAGCPENSPS